MMRGPAILAAIACLTSCQHAEAHDVHDLVIAGGLVVDGSGAPARHADIVIDGGVISAVVEAGAQVSATRTIDATGLIVAPGFVDPHTHAGGDLRSSNRDRRANLAYLFQGVTTVVVGNDGDGSTQIAAQAADARAGGIGSNAAFLAGFGYIRSAVVGDANRAPDAAELAEMEGQVRSAMCEGAFGFSTGLYYTPQNFASQQEVAALATVAAEQGGYYDTHLRNESDNAALAEALAIGAASGAPVHLAHIKRFGTAAGGQSDYVIGEVERARANGQRVTADQYPWLASGTRVSNALVPQWARDGGLDGLRERLAEPALRERIAAEMRGNLAGRGGPGALLFTGALGAFQADTGQTLEQYAEAQGLAPVEAAIALLLVGDMRVASFNINAADMAAFAVQDWVATGSDGSTGHPRKYASFPKAYQDFVVERELLTLEQFVRRSTSLPAQIIGLQDRGLIAPVMAADIVVFDPEGFAPRATYEQPRELSQGVRYLLVNGRLAIDSGEFTGLLAGQPLLRSNAGTHETCRTGTGRGIR